MYPVLLSDLLRYGTVIFGMPAMLHAFLLGSPAVITRVHLLRHNRYPFQYVGLFEISAVLFGPPAIVAAFLFGIPAVLFEMPATFFEMFVFFISMPTIFFGSSGVSLCDARPHCQGLPPSFRGCCAILVGVPRRFF